jgi:hypothetical protein
MRLVHVEFPLLVLPKDQIPENSCFVSVLSVPFFLHRLPKNWATDETPPDLGCEETGSREHYVESVPLGRCGNASINLLPGAVRTVIDTLHAFRSRCRN